LEKVPSVVSVKTTFSPSWSLLKVRTWFL